eukprot:gnl/MRDRNA2_/MRDRNA2_145971_c0_seq1.p1 gnl/MRDRNA2_/MRDRNA2_145971_c0~~gnl/MRDRNA2_/MRDRNA2_145971_c0_seq1.p1  ORF type:complete len:495 (+),score=56.69 gnl/MRDRNA2_/MRDRNA2_145971_c0_seq1:87-1571(+)
MVPVCIGSGVVFVCNAPGCSRVAGRMLMPEAGNSAAPVGARASQTATNTLQATMPTNNPRVTTQRRPPATARPAWQPTHSVRGNLVPPNSPRTPRVARPAGDIHYEKDLSRSRSPSPYGVQLWSCNIPGSPRRPQGQRSQPMVLATPTTPRIEAHQSTYEVQRQQSGPTPLWHSVGEVSIPRPVLEPLFECQPRRPRRSHSPSRTQPAAVRAHSPVQLVITSPRRLIQRQRSQPAFSQSPPSIHVVQRQGSQPVLPAPALSSTQVNSNHNSGLAVNPEHFMTSPRVTSRAPPAFTPSPPTVAKHKSLITITDGKENPQNEEAKICTLSDSSCQTEEAYGTTYMFRGIRTPPAKTPPRRESHDCPMKENGNENGFESGSPDKRNTQSALEDVYRSVKRLRELGDIEGEEIAMKIFETMASSIHPARHALKESCTLAAQSEDVTPSKESKRDSCASTPPSSRGSFVTLSPPSRYSGAKRADFTPEDPRLISLSPIR